MAGRETAGLYSMQKELRDKDHENQSGRLDNRTFRSGHELLLYPLQRSGNALYCRELDLLS